MKPQTKSTVIQLLSDGKAYSKKYLSQRSGFTIPAISTLLDLWAKQGLLQHTPIEGASWGKHSGLYSIDPLYARPLVVNVRPDCLEGALCDLLGNPTSKTVRIPLQQILSSDILREALSRLLGHFSLQFSQILLASHGTVFNKLQNQQSSSMPSEREMILPHLRIGMIPIQRYLQNICDLPTLIESDCIVLAHNYLYKDSIEDFILVHLDYGIGASLVTRNEVWGRKQGFLTPGQIGHTPVIDNGKLCKCGNYGCLETIASTSEIIDEVYRHIQKNNRTLLAQVVAQRALTFPDIVQAVERKDPVAMKVCSNAIHYIGLSIISMIHFINPPRIYLAGEWTLLGDFLIVELQQTISHCSIYREQENTELYLCQTTHNLIFRGLTKMLLLDIAKSF